MLKKKHSCISRNVSVAHFKVPAEVGGQRNALLYDHTSACSLISQMKF